MRDSRQEIADTLAESGGAERETALRVLGCAVRWAADTLARPDSASADSPSDDTEGADALTALFALDSALRDTRDLAEGLPRLLEAARPGDQLRQDSRDLMAELTKVADLVASERAALEQLAAREEELRRLQAEHEELRQEAEKLRQLERLEKELPALRAQQQVIETRLRELRGRDLGAAEQELDSAADALLTLTEQQLAVLEPRTRQVLERTAASQAALKATAHKLSEGRSDLASHQDRLQHIQTEQGPVIASLARHAQADRELAQALREAAGVDTGDLPQELAAQGLTLNEVEALTQIIEQRLADADRILGHILKERPDDEDDGAAMITRSQP